LYPKFEIHKNSYYLAEPNRIAIVQECDARMLNRITKVGYKNFLSDYIGYHK